MKALQVILQQVRTQPLYAKLNTANEQAIEEAVHINAGDFTGFYQVRSSASLG